MDWMRTDDGKLLRKLPITDDELAAIQRLCNAAIETDFFIVNGEPEMHKALLRAMARIDTVQDHPQWFTAIDYTAPTPDLEPVTDGA